MTSRAGIGAIRGAAMPPDRHATPPQRLRHADACLVDGDQMLALERLAAHLAAVA